MLEHEIFGDFTTDCETEPAGKLDSELSFFLVFYGFS